MTKILVLLSLLASNLWAISEKPDRETVFTAQNIFFECCINHSFQDDDEDSAALNNTPSVAYPLGPVSRSQSGYSADQRASCALPASRAPPALLIS